MDAKNYALWLLGKRAYTEQRLREKLESKKYFASDVDIAINFCKDQRFINDIEYSKSFIRERDAIRPRGKRVLKLELKKRGVSDSDISVALADPELQNRSEVDLARELVRRKSRQYDTLEEGRARQRMFGMLARRGFEIDIIKEVVNEHFKKSES